MDESASAAIMVEEGMVVMRVVCQIFTAWDFSCLLLSLLLLWFLCDMVGFGSFVPEIHVSVDIVALVMQVFVLVSMSM